MANRLTTYIKLMRLHRPIGVYLVLWPTLWALWIAAKGLPDFEILVIFMLGAVLMRSAGCVINDFADSDFDGHVARTKDRPLVTGEIRRGEAFVLFFVLCIIAFGLVLLTNKLTIQLSFGAVALAACYPFMKRYTHVPQIVLGAAFAWAIPMAFAAQANSVPKDAWILYLAVVVWTVTYDTFYAMCDREDDLKIGVKSTAILFGDGDRMITAMLQVFTLIILGTVGNKFALGSVYWLSLGLAALFFVYQQFLIRRRDPQKCFQAFLNNNWVGIVIFVGIVVDYSFNNPQNLAPVLESINQLVSSLQSK
ncbi:4-hydroxybenzoate octaprenyltransferase [Thalassocella blandensis]|nr:4-hydroxybenzoate octaprenyltransferase [Thalassocella blandensis]